jgi:hypothetical protein
MFVVCDTCSLIMLLRIAPDMFSDQRYRCVTISPVWKEFVGTQRFKHRYPWREALRSCIKTLPAGQLATPEFRRQQSFVNATAKTARNPRRNHRPYELSKTDLEVLTTAVANHWQLTTVEHNLTDIAEQEFDLQVLSPLHLVNEWLAAGLIAWNDDRQSVLQDWIDKNERPQPPAEIRRFEKLTGRKYPQG